MLGLVQTSCKNLPRVHLRGYVHTVYPVLLASADFNDWWVVADRRHSYPQPFWRARTSKAGKKTVDFRALSIVERPKDNLYKRSELTQTHWCWNCFFVLFFLSFLKPIQLGRRDMPTPTPRTPAMYLLPPRMPSVKPPPGNMYWPVWCGNHPALLN